MNKPRGLPTATLGDEHFLREPTAPCQSKIIGAGRVRNKRIVIQRRRDRFFTLVMITRGQGWCETASLPRQELRAGQVLLLFPGEYHSFGPDQQGWDELWVMATGAIFRGLESDGVISRQRPVLNTGLDSELAMHLGQVVDGVRDGSGSSALWSARAHLAWCLAATRDKERRVTSDAAQAVGHARALIEADLARAWALEELATACGLSVSALRTAFTAAYGAPPIRWQRDQRIAEAKRVVIAEPNLDLTALAKRLGFADAAHIAHRFRAATGMSPGAWRRQRLGV